MEVRHFTVRDALEFLGIKPPAIRKDMSQEEVNKLVAEWKETTLKDHYKQERIKAHPDRPEGDEDRFKSLEHAFNEVVGHLQLRKPRIPPAEVTKCRDCGAARVPVDAAHCHDCGLRYDTDADKTGCPACGAAREPKGAKFCHGCGYDYQVPDGLKERLLMHGFTKLDIQELELKGTLDRWRAMPAWSPELAKDIEFTFNVKQLSRGHRGLSKLF